MSSRVAPLPAVLLAALLLVPGLSPAPVARAGGAGGVLRLALLRGLEGLDPVRAEDDGSRILVANVYDRLYAYQPLHPPHVLQPRLPAAMPDVSE
ncbi:MAG: hypothetical protein ACC662_00940, partial [Planctomycetota bacterium]